MLLPIIVSNYSLYIIYILEEALELKPSDNWRDFTVLKPFQSDVGSEKRCDDENITKEFDLVDYSLYFYPLIYIFHLRFNC